MDELKNLGYNDISKDSQKDILIFRNKKTGLTIKANLYWGAFKKYMDETQVQIPFLYDEMQALCKLTKEYNRGEVL